MKLNIREAKPEDAAQIAKLHIASWRAAYKGIVADEWLDSQDFEDRESRWFENLNKPPDRKQRTFLAFNESSLAGFATVGESRDDRYSEYAELWAIYTDPNFFGKGAGRALFEACRQYATELEYSKMFVNVLKDNQLGRDFYIRAGAELIPNSEGTVMLGEQEYNDVKYQWKELER